MARKVFISVLGTGLYEKCQYVSDDFESSETAFIQQATLEYHHADSWANDCKIFILTTEKAKELNWDKTITYRERPYTKVKVDYRGLEALLGEANLPVEAKNIDIPDGKEENEMWTIFETLFKIIEDGDELYFDLTHSFRYLPMLVLVFGNYAKFLKKVKIKAITYGNYEARDRATNKAPIVDLLPLSALQDWTFATADFLENGYTDRLVDLSKKGYEPLMRKAETRTYDTKKLKDIVTLMEIFSSDMRTCRGMNVVNAKTINNARQEIPKLQTVIIPQLKPVFDKLQESINGFEERGNINNMFTAAQWCFDNQQYQQCTTFLEEGVISYFCNRHCIQLDDRKKRELITSAFYIAGQIIPEEKWKVASENHALLKEIVNDDLLKNKELVNTFNQLVELRNDYNHCGMRKHPLKPDDIKKKIGQFKDTIFPLLSSSPEVNKISTPLFLNLSNHPSSSWSKEQREAAEEYGEVEDMEFPQIAADIDEDTLLSLVDEYEKKIMDKAKGKDLTIHIMGEMTFTFSLVERLKMRGVTCVASTTERKVEEHDSQKLSTFQFVRFRRY